MHGLALSQTAGGRGLRLQHLNEALDRLDGFGGGVYRNAGAGFLVLVVAWPHVAATRGQLALKALRVLFLEEQQTTTEVRDRTRRNIKIVAGSEKPIRKITDK
jgi:hypothetical protein